MFTFNPYNIIKNGILPFKRSIANKPISLREQWWSYLLNPFVLLKTEMDSYSNEKQILANTTGSKLALQWYLKMKLKKEVNILENFNLQSVKIYTNAENKPRIVRTSAENTPIIIYSTSEVQNNESEIIVQVPNLTNSERELVSTIISECLLYSVQVNII